MWHTCEFIRQHISQLIRQHVLMHDVWGSYTMAMLNVNNEAEVQ